MAHGLTRPQFLDYIGQGGWTVEYEPGRHAPITEVRTGIAAEIAIIFSVSGAEQVIARTFFTGMFLEGARGNEMHLTLLEDGKMHGVAFHRPVDAPPGWPIPRVESYGPASPNAQERYGAGDCRYATMFGAHPAALRKGNRLATGHLVGADPRDPRDGKHVLVNLDGAWVKLDAQFVYAFCTNQPSPVVHKDFWQLCEKERLGGQAQFAFMERTGENE